MPREMILPLAFEPALPGIEGGGATAAEPAPPSVAGDLPAAAILLGHGQLRRGRNHRRVPDVDVPQTALRRGVHAGRRLDDRGLRSPQSPRRFSVQLRRGCYHALRKHWRPLAIGWHCFRRGRDRGHRKRGQPQIGCSCCRCQRHCGLGLLRPGHDIRQWHIVIELDVGGSDNGLGLIVGLGWHRNDRLRRMFRLALARQRPARAPRIERRQILRWSVVDHVGATEDWTIQDPRWLRPEPDRSP